MAVTPTPSHVNDSNPTAARRALVLENGDAATVQSGSAPLARGVFARDGLLRRGLALMLPMLTSAAVLVLAAAVYYVRWGFRLAMWHGRVQAMPVWLAFNDIGSYFASRVGDLGEAVARIGYDGQYYYYLARDPRVMLQCVQTLRHCPIDANPLREERILYPLTARFVTLNNPNWLHISLFAVNFAAILITVLIVGQLCVEADASRWLGMVAGVFCGELLGLLHDLADPYAVIWVVVAVYFLRKNRPLWCAVAVGAALLAREQLVVILPLLALPLFAQRRWRTLAAWVVIALAPFVAWQAAIRVIFGHWGFLGTVATTRGVTFPVHGLWEYRHGPEFGLTVLFVAVPLLFTILITLDWLRPHDPGPARPLLARNTPGPCADPYRRLASPISVVRQAAAHLYPCEPATCYDVRGRLRSAAADAAGSVLSLPHFRPRTVDVYSHQYAAKRYLDVAFGLQAWYY